MAGLLESFIRGGQAGRQSYENRHADERESALGKLAGQAYNTPKEGQNSLLALMAPYSAQFAQQQQGQFQAQEDRTRSRVAGAAKFMIEAVKSKDPARIQGAYQAVVPVLAEVGKAQGKTPPAQWDDTMLPHVYQLAGENGGSIYGNPYSDQPSDIQSLRILQENPELAALDKERRQYSGMVPKMAETSRGIGSWTPGGEITLSPIVGPDAGSAPVTQPTRGAPTFTGPDGMPIDVSGVTDPRVRESIVGNPAAWNAAIDGSNAQLPPQQRKGSPEIAQPYSKPDAPPAGYRRNMDGTMSFIPGGPADPSVIAQRPIDPAKKMKLEQTKRKEVASLDALDTKIDQTVALIDTLLAGRGQFGGVTGMGATAAKIPGSPWADLSAKLDTLKARSIFGALQEMRTNSPTGGALGSTTEKELGMLGNSETQLQQSQSPEALEAGLRAYRQNLVDSKTRLRRGVEDFYEAEGGESNAPATQSNPQIDSLLEKYR